MNVAVMGLGYVGTVTATCLADAGHRVIGIDVASQKVEMLNDGLSPVIEPRVTETLRRVRDAGKLTASTNVAEALADCDLCIICVGTPSATSGAVDTSALEVVIGQLGHHIGPARDRPVTVVLRSTVLPGTTRQIVLVGLESKSGAPAGGAFEVLFHPEFLREGHAVEDYYNPSRIVIGERVPGAAEPLLRLYDGFTAPIYRTSLELAEMAKYCDNAFHALKIAFANEVGRLAQAHGVDSQALMEVFCADRRLNLSSAYLKPGFAFGGSCLPKDLRALVRAARQKDVATPVLAAVLPSNEVEIERARDYILASGCREIGLWGLAFKPGTDDLRESPFVRLAELLTGKGLSLRIYDPAVQLTRIVGKNRAFIDSKLPHLASLMVHGAEELEAASLIVLAHAVERNRIERWLALERQVLDLTGMPDPPEHARFASIHGQWNDGTIRGG
jgi:GDP-mannose 6-dehydrogenase